MNITIETRDLFTVPQGYYLAHCISADFTLGAGIAKTFDEVYNMRYKLFKHYPDYEYDGFGDVLPMDNVFNLVTKQKHWQKPTYYSLEGSLHAMKRMMKEFDITKLAMPLIGCGLDKLNWDMVLEIIEDTFKDMDVEILICKL